MDYVIEKSIPIPEMSRCGKWGNLINSMEIGDSVVIPRGKDQAVRSAAKIHKARVTIRTVDASSVRMWLVSRAPKNG